MSRHFFGVPGEFVPILAGAGLLARLLLLPRRLRVDPPSCGFVVVVVDSSYRSVVVAVVAAAVFVVGRNDAPHKNTDLGRSTTFTTWCVLVSFYVGRGEIGAAAQ